MKKAIGVLIIGLLAFTAPGLAEDSIWEDGTGGHRSTHPYFGTGQTLYVLVWEEVTGETNTEGKQHERSYVFSPDKLALLEYLNEHEKEKVEPKHWLVFYSGRGPVRGNFMGMFRLEPVLLKSAEGVLETKYTKWSIGGKRDE